MLTLLLVAALPLAASAHDPDAPKAAAFFLGTTELSRADEIEPEPEPVTEVPVADTAPQADSPRVFVNEVSDPFHAGKLRDFQE